jgi:hypothetical protein
MKAVLFLALALALAVAVTAQEPPRCRSPREFESRIVEIDPKREFEVRAHYAYDFVNERTSAFEEVRNASGRDFFHRIHLYREKKGYWINLKNGQCSVETITWPFHRIEVPENATFVDQFEIGTDAVPNAGVLCNAWEDKMSHARWFGTFTARDCLPVDENFRSQETGFIHNAFYDVVLGISDPNIFIPPSQCTSGKISHGRPHHKH